MFDGLEERLRCSIATAANSSYLIEAGSSHTGTTRPLFERALAVQPANPPRVLHWLASSISL